MKTAVYLSSDVKLGQRALSRIEKGVKQICPMAEFDRVKQPPLFYSENPDWKKVETLEEEKHGEARFYIQGVHPHEIVSVVCSLVEREIRILRDSPKAQRILKTQRPAKGQVPRTWTIQFFGTQDEAEEIFYKLHWTSEYNKVAKPTIEPEKIRMPIGYEKKDS